MVFRDFDEATYESKLKEAHDLLVEARKVDPTNTEILLHLPSS